VLPTTGPANCWRSAFITRGCCVCGARPEIMHRPTRQAGIYCPAHCVACNPAPEAPASPGAAIPLPEGRGAVLVDAGARRAQSPDTETFNHRVALDFGAFLIPYSLDCNGKNQGPR
jgi:hypothetical protein